MRKFPYWATTTQNLPNGDPNKAEPVVLKRQIGWEIEKPLVQYMNWIMNLLGHFSRANNEMKLEANTYIAEVGELVILDNSASAVTGYLPVDPLDGQWVIFGGETSFTEFGVAIDGNGNDIMITGDQVCNLNINEILFIFHWRDADNMWKINKWAQRGRIIL